METVKGEERWLAFHGLSVRVRAEGLGALLSLVDHDFAYFTGPCSPAPTFNIELRRGPPGDGPVGAGRSRFVRWRARETVVLFFGTARVRYRFAEGQVEITSEDPQSAYEALYLSLLSLMGEALDDRGLHRLHGFAFRGWGRGVILLGASGAGKSTLGLELLERSTIDLISDDTPLVARGAAMRAFPQRIALKERPDFADEQVRRFPRQLSEEKFVVSVGRYRDRVAAEAEIDWLVLLRRSGEISPSVRRCARWRAAWPLAKWLVIGYETPQIWELFLRPSARDVLKKARIALSRARVAWDLFWRARVATLERAGTPEQCRLALSSFLESHA